MLNLKRELNITDANRSSKISDFANCLVHKIQIHVGKKRRQTIPTVPAKRTPNGSVWFYAKEQRKVTKRIKRRNYKRK